ncbi:hypothetical protein ACFW04_009477 [Cataglyphis niger]
MFSTFSLLSPSLFFFFLFGPIC